MAQKKRGLGRGLQALIPEAQAETPASRPTDVFFPEAHHRQSDDSGSGAQERVKSAESGRSTSTRRNADDIAATLLAPSKRTRRSSRSGSRSRATGTRTGGGRSAASAGSAASSASAGSAASATSAAVAASAGVAASAPSAAEGVSRETAAEVVAPLPVEETPVTPPPAVERKADRGAKRSAAAASAEVPSEAPTEVRAAASAASPGRVQEERVETSANETAEESAEEEPALVPVPGATFADLPVDVIVPNPHQPRQVFDEEDISELAASIKEVGLLQPIVVRRVDAVDGGGDADAEDAGAGRYELIMGERRLRAAKEAGLETIPAVVRYTADEDLLRDALLENLHRVQLNPLEEAAAYQQLLEDFNCTHAELSRRIARSRSQISNTLRLMKLPPLVQRRLAAGVLSAGHARALLGLPDAAAMERLAQRIVAEGLSVRATEEVVAMHDEPDAPKPKPMRARSATLPALSTRLSDAFDTRVKVTRGAKKGRITIEFAGDEDLARIVSTLAPGTSLTED